MSKCDAIKEYLSAVHPEAMMADGLEEAAGGVMCRFNAAPVALYDYGKCINIFMKQGCTQQEAQEHFAFNVIGAWVGEGTPAFIMTADELEEGGA